MRVKRQKKNRRAVSFYKVTFGFRHPYKVLCDGTFIHHLVVNQITPADIAVSNLLGAPVKLFTTRCQHMELKRMGKGYSESLEAALMLNTATCNHEEPTAADVCISEVIGKNNLEHFFVGSQDVDLRKKLQEVPGVPLIYCLRNALQLEQPSDFQRKFAKASEEERLHMTKSERNMLEKRAMQILSSNSIGTSILSARNERDNASNEPDEMNFTGRRQVSSRNRLGVKDRVQFKRNKAKGPNPLSCKKKKNPEKSKCAPQKESESSKRIRKRTRSRKGKGLQETTT